ncbi:MAG: hypothetical protein U0704_15080 [Candidatus Eisenbacteria bacterium]
MMLVRRVLCVLVLGAGWAPMAPQATAAELVTDSVKIAPGAWTESWRESARLLPGVAARAHARADVPYGPALYGRVAPHAVLGVRLDEMPLVDPWSGHAAFELAPEAVARIVRYDDGSLRLVTARPGDATRIVASATSEAVASGLPGFAAANRERYAATLTGRRTGERGTLELFGTEQARWFGDRAPHFVAEPYPGTASASLGGAAFDDGRTPGNALSGSSGAARLAWTSASEAWRASVSGAQSHDDWREYRHAYLLNMAHTPRVTQDLDAGAVAIERRGRVDATLRGGIAKSAWHRGDGVLFDRFDDWAAQQPGSPRFDLDDPYFYLPGHIYGAIEKHEAVRGEAALGVRTARERGAWRAVGADVAWRTWKLRGYQATFGGDPVAWSGYGYDERGETADDGVRHVHRVDAGVTNEFQAGGAASLSVTAGVTWQERPSPDVVVAVSPYDTLGVRSVGTFRRSTPTLAVVAHAAPDGALDWRFRLAREVPELAGEAYARAGDAKLAAQWAMSADLRHAAEGHGATQVSVVMLQVDEASGVPVPVYGSSSFHDGIVVEVLHERAWANGLGLRAGAAWSDVRMRWYDANQRNVSWSGGTAAEQSVDADDSRTWEVFAHGTARHGEPRTGWQADALFRGATGAPWSPTQPYNEATLAAVSATPSGNANSRRMPWAATLDVGLAKSFAFAGVRFDAVLRVLNVFDRHNVAEVWTGTGRADDSGWLATEDGQAWLSIADEQAREHYELSQRDPTHWSAPRTLTLAVRVAY